MSLVDNHMSTSTTSLDQSQCWAKIVSNSNISAVKNRLQKGNNYNINWIDKSTLHTRTWCEQQWQAATCVFLFVVYCESARGEWSYFSSNPKYTWCVYGEKRHFNRAI